MTTVKQHPMAQAIRYRFGDLVLSPSARTLSRNGVELPLIPRYFDLLTLLVRQRGKAVSRQQILDEVWSDVVVSDGALSQAIRTLRRTLRDESREPIYIRTVSRYGYKFVFESVIEEDDGASGAATSGQPGGTGMPAAPTSAESEDSAAAAGSVEVGLFEPLLDKLSDPTAADDERRDAAERLHALGTRETLARLGKRHGQVEARAILRDARWDVAEAGNVPLLGEAEPLRVAWALVRLRLRRAARLAKTRWATASLGGAIAGLFAGALGGAALLAGPGSTAAPTLVVTLAGVGFIGGAIGAAGVGAGLAAAEAVARSARGLALVVGGAAGGGVVGGAALLLGKWMVADVFGGYAGTTIGIIEGLALGGAAGLGYGLTTRAPFGGGMATPHGAARVRAVITTGACCGGAAMLLSLGGRNLVGGTLNILSASFQGSQVSLLPLARLLGEGDVGALSRLVVSAFEGFCFGCGVVAGLTRRPHG
jgi:DNA-binding winged helix-turn-helix (wHTH) protein